MINPVVGFFLGVVFVFVLALVLANRREVKREYSKTTLHEDAIIEDVVYTPSQNESRIEPSFGGFGTIGLGPSGVGFGIGKDIQITNVVVPEEFVVVFRCQRGKFTITREEVYQKFKNHKGRAVDLTCREVYHVTYDLKKVVEREFVGYDFLDATLK